MLLFFAQVAEMTGRKSRDVRQPNGRYRYEAKPDNADEFEAFKEGYKLVLIYSAAFAAGVSFHADPKYPNHLQRCVFPIELPYAADRFLQLLGRTSRAGEAHPAKINVLSTHMAGENRFVNAIASKASSMGALTAAIECLRIKFPVLC